MILNFNKIGAFHAPPIKGTKMNVYKYKLFQKVYNTIFPQTEIVITCQDKIKDELHLSVLLNNRDIDTITLKDISILSNDEVIGFAFCAACKLKNWYNGFNYQTVLIVNYKPNRKPMYFLNGKRVSNDLGRWLANSDALHLDGDCIAFNTQSDRIDCFYIVANENRLQNVIDDLSN